MNIIGFCKGFNAETQNLEPGIPIPCVVTVYADKSFSFITKTPPASFFIKKAAGLEKGSETPGREIVGSITMVQVREIAEQKMVDLNADDLEQASKMIAGSARSIGITVEG